MRKPTLEEILKFADSDLDAPAPPSPYEIALRVACASLAAGRFGDDIGGAMVLGWMAVIPFYQGQRAYGDHAQMLFDVAQHASAPEGENQVAGGETGHTGETTQRAAPRAPAVNMSAEELAAMQARQARISEAYDDVITTEKERDKFASMIAAGDKSDETQRLLEKAQAAFDLAREVQSAVYL